MMAFPLKQFFASGWRVTDEGRRDKQSLLGSCPCDRGCRFGLLGCGGPCRLSRRRRGLRLPVRLIILVLDGPDLHAAFQHSSILHADTLGDHITR